MSLDASLQRAFSERADGVNADDVGLIGLFGDGVPLALISALGGLAVDIKAPPLADRTDGPTVQAVTAIAEPFLDTFTARFLHRFAAGAFDRFASLVFARSDVAGLTAYQYALELRRQGRVSAKGPRLYLWNMLHDPSAAAARFNAVELERLTAHLSETLGTTLDEARLRDRVAAEVRRHERLAALPAGGADAFIARNAGRWMTPEAHTVALPDLPAGSGPRIALVGTACATPVLHQICSGLGQVIADLQDYGRWPPQPVSAADLFRDIIHDPLAPRAAPPSRFTKALLAGTEDADLVVASVDPNDDSFGWEMPGLRRSVEDRGARFVDLGFRPFDPDEAWQDAARARIAEALS